MELSYFYNQVVKFGIQNDPRKKSRVKNFEDTAILYGDPKTKVKKVLVGIDIEVGELLLADKIRSTQGLDLVISHHPEGYAYAQLYKVMSLQVDILCKLGVAKEIAQGLLEERQREVQRKILPQNHSRAVDAAKLLDLPFMCAHTPADNHVFSYLAKLINKEKPKTAQDIIDILIEIPEYKTAIKEKVGPRIIMGAPGRGAGKVLIEMTGGTEGSDQVYGNLYKTGIRTLVCMHLSEEHFKKVKDANLNVIIAGHISSDTLGLNLLLDNVQKQANQKLTVLNCSGFRRVTRI